MTSTNVSKLRDWISGFVTHNHSKYANPALPSESLVHFFRRNVPSFVDWDTICGDSLPDEIKIDLPQVFAKLESDGGVPAILSAPEIISSTPVYGEAQASALTCLAIFSFFLPDWNIPKSLHEPQKVSFQTSECDESEKFDLSRCFACNEEAGCLERIVIARGRRVVHRRCFQCDRCHSTLRRGLYSVTGHESSGTHEKYECLRHEHEDLLAMFNSEKKPVRDSEAVVGNTAIEANESLDQSMQKDTFSDNGNNDVNPETIEDSPKEKLCHNISDEKSADIPEITLEEINLNDDNHVDDQKTVPTEQVSVDAANEHHEKPDGNDVEIDTSWKDTSTEEPDQSDASEVNKEPEDVHADSRNLVDHGNHKEAECPAEEPTQVLLPVAPPRRKKKGLASRDSSASGPRSPLPKVKPALPPKPASLKSVEEPKKPVEDLYPDDLNPFGSDEESDDGHSGYNSSLNPFADDDDDEDLDSSDINPFGSESDAGSIQGVRLRTQSPASSIGSPSLHRLSLNNGSLTNRADDRRNTVLGITPRTKRHAPPPPPPRPSIEAKKVAKPPRPPRPKKRPAPPPPLPFRRTIVTEDLLSKEDVEERLHTLDADQKSLEEESSELWMLYASAMSENIPEDQVRFNVNIQQWLALCEKKCSFLQKEAELVHQWRKHYLDELHTDVEYQLRCIIEKPDSTKTEKDARLEARLLLLLLDVIERKNRLIESQLAPASWENAPERSHEEVSSSQNEAEKAKKKKKKLKLRLKKIKKLVGDPKKESKSAPSPQKA